MKVKVIAMLMVATIGLLTSCSKDEESNNHEETFIDCYHCTGSVTYQL